MGCAERLMPRGDWTDRLWGGRCACVRGIAGFMVGGAETVRLAIVKTLGAGWFTHVDLR